jgi:hypothetical protein
VVQQIHHGEVDSTFFEARGRTCLHTFPGACRGEVLASSFSSSSGPCWSVGRPLLHQSSSQKRKRCVACGFHVRWVTVEQRHREGAIQQKHDLPGERQAIPNSLAFNHATNPVFKPFLVGGTHLDSGVTGHMREFRRRAKKAASSPLWVSGGGSEMDENAAHLLGKSALGLVEPAPEKGEVRLVSAVEIGSDEIVLAAEVIVKRPLGDAGLLGNSVHADATDTLAVKQLACSGDDALSRWNRVACHVYRPVNIQSP